MAWRELVGIPPGSLDDQLATLGHGVAGGSPEIHQDLIPSCLRRHGATSVVPRVDFTADVFTESRLSIF